MSPPIPNKTSFAWVSIEWSRGTKVRSKVSQLSQTKCVRNHHRVWLMLSKQSTSAFPITPSWYLPSVSTVCISASSPSIDVKHQLHTSILRINSTHQLHTWTARIHEICVFYINETHQLRASTLRINSAQQLHASSLRINSTHQFPASAPRHASIPRINFPHQLHASTPRINSAP